MTIESKCHICGATSYRGSMKHGINCSVPDTTANKDTIDELDEILDLFKSDLQTLEEYPNSRERL